MRSAKVVSRRLSALRSRYHMIDSQRIVGRTRLAAQPAGRLLAENVARAGRRSVLLPLRLIREAPSRLISAGP
jgi:hypothetical protein